MAVNLLETYKGRLKVAERMYSQRHNGEKLSDQRKIATAKLLQNTSKYINESFTPTMATQSGLGVNANGTLGLFKKFAMNMVNVVMPNLIANDLAIVYPMSSMSGYLNYIEYTTGNAKGEVADDALIANPWRIGDVTTYTGQAVVETLSNATALAWTPVEKAWNAETGEELAVAADGSGLASAFTGKVKYLYNNTVVPQAKLPMLKAEMKSIPLLAHARRIAVYYSQIAAFQAKTDYGFDLGDQLAEKAAGQLSYEIDTEVVGIIDETAGAARITWNKAVPAAVSKAEHYEGFSEAIEIGKQLIYDATKRFAPNYMLIASDILPVLTFIKGFQAAPAGVINGPYFAGTLNGVKVFVTPAMRAGRFVLGVNGDDMMSSAVVYAPYMPIVPTQLLGFADGGMTQGWSTLYDLKVLNPSLVVAGEIVNEPANASNAVLLANPVVDASGEVESN